MTALTKIPYSRARVAATRTYRLTLTSAFSRGIRIRPSSDANSEQSAGPSEGHTVDKAESRAAPDDTQAQQAQGSLNAQKEDTPVQIHGDLYKGGSTGTGGASKGGSEDAAAPSWWSSMKQKMGMTSTNDETKHGSKSGNIQN